MGKNFMLIMLFSKIQNLRFMDSQDEWRSAKEKPQKSLMML